MAHKKGVGSTDNGRDSHSKRLGVKLFGGQAALAGNIIIRQRGTKYHPGENVYMGKDFTIHAKVAGKVSFRKSRLNRMFVSIDPTGSELVNGSNGNGQLATTTKTAPKPKAASAAPAKQEEIKATLVAADVDPAPVHLEDAPEMPSVAPGITDEAELAVANADQGGALNTAEVTGSDRPESVVLPSGRKVSLNDLTVIEGVGPAISGLLSASGIDSWRALADADLDFVENVLTEAGPGYAMHNPGTWSKQAALAADGNWDELEQYQQTLDGGREEE